MKCLKTNVHQVRVRVSLTGEDVRLVVNSRDTVAQVLLCLSEKQFKILKVSEFSN